MTRRTAEIPVPYIFWILDGGLANYAGVSPDEAIGEPNQASIEAMFTALEKGYRVVVVTWRDPGIVWSRLDRAQLGRLGMADFRIQNDMPWGRPVLWVTGQCDYQAVLALERRGKQRP